MPLELTPSELVLSGWLFTAPLLLVLWFICRIHQNAVLADVGFCLGFALVVLWYGLETGGDIERRLLLAIMGLLYGLRLGFHLLQDRVIGKPEDARYQALRERLGGKEAIGVFVYFQGQALAIVVFSLPLMVLMNNPKALWTGVEMMGVLLWVLAFSGEALADWQLTRFRADHNNVGKTCMQGLWRYSRHPNYFFEGMMWCAYAVMGIGVPNGWVTLIGPVLMMTALLKVSGIPFTEAQALASRGEGYREYQRTTNAFIPWFPKKSSM